MAIFNVKKPPEVRTNFYGRRLIRAMTNTKSRRRHGPITSIFSAVVALPALAASPVPFHTTYDITQASNNFFNDGDGAIYGHFPPRTSLRNGDGGFPLFIWMPGTGGTPQGAGAQAYITREMAKRGFASFAVAYPELYKNDGSVTFDEKIRPVMCSNNAHSAVSVLCKLDNVDCSKGIAVAGFSQGTHFAGMAAKFNKNVNAEFMNDGARPTFEGRTGVADESVLGQYIPKTRRRYVTTENDVYFAWDSTGGHTYTTPSKEGAEANLKKASGYDCGANVNCIQSDGSGYFVVTSGAVNGAPLYHGSFMGSKDKGSGTAIIPASWYSGTENWKFPATFDWLARTGKSTRELSQDIKTLIHNNCNADWAARTAPFGGNSKGSAEGKCYLKSSADGYHILKGSVKGSGI